MSIPRAHGNELAYLPAYESRPSDIRTWDQPGDGLLGEVPPAADPRPVADRVGTERVAVLILGSGIDVAHPAIVHAIGDVRDFTRSPSKGADIIGHGTYTAGLIAGRRSHWWPGGYCPAATVYSGKVIRDVAHGSADTVRAGLRWAAELRPDICIIQAEMLRGDRRLLAQLHKVYCGGTTLIAPAGNGYATRRDETWPGKSSQVISVAGVDAAGRPWSVGCIGPDLTLAAWVGPRASLWPGRRLASLTGTGVAAAMVAGVAAAVVGRMKRQGVETGPEHVERELIRHCRPADATAPAGEVGMGSLWPRRWVDSLPPAALELSLEWAAADSLERERRRQQVRDVESAAASADGPPDEPV